MLVIENDCCSCATGSYPCTGAHKRVPHLYCDRCNDEVDVVYDVVGGDICEECLKEMFEKKTFEQVVSERGEIDG